MGIGVFEQVTRLSGGAKLTYSAPRNPHPPLWNSDREFLKWTLKLVWSIEFKFVGEICFFPFLMKWSELLIRITAFLWKGFMIKKLLELRLVGRPSVTIFQGDWGDKTLYQDQDWNYIDLQVLWYKNKMVNDLFLMPVTCSSRFLAYKHMKRVKIDGDWSYVEVQCFMLIGLMCGFLEQFKD
jgi:hypothetical protein